MNSRIIMNVIKITLVTAVFITIFIGLKRSRKVEETDDDLSNFKKDENGFYPWEVDTDTSADRISKDAKRFNPSNRAKRGRW